MKKLILLIFAVQCIYIANAQWTNKTVNNQFDPIYKVSYTEEYDYTDLRMQNVDGLLNLYLAGEFWCEGDPIVELSFLVRGQRKYYATVGIVVGEFKNVLAISFDLEGEEYFQDFKQSSELKIIVQQDECPNEFYKYDMTGSSQAVKFLRSY